jgi:hypothetical protein
MAREGIFDEVLPELLADRHHAARPLLTRSARDAFECHSWPGNLREFVGVLDEIVGLADGETIRLEHLPPHLQRAYLRLPLHARALGFLLEEVDGQGLPDEYVIWRIEQIDASLAAIPLQENEELATIGRFFSLLDDGSDDHRRAATEVQRRLQLDQALRHAALASAFWEQIAAGRVPPTVARLIRMRSEEAAAARSAIEREIEIAQATGAIEADPWLRLFREVHSLPLLREAKTGELAKAFLAVFNLVKLVAPSVIEQARADASSGGFARLRERAVAALKGSNDEERAGANDAKADAPPPARLTREDWLRISQKFSTQRAAVTATGYDPKTLAKYFRRHRIRNPWKAAL